MEVKVIKASDGPIIRDRRKIGEPLKLERKRVAAYVRVSTDGEEQLQSFKSQKEYYQEKISQNKDWVMVGIYADEGITGTKTKKRDNFLKMIDDCMNGMIDIVLTKSISRFSRNLVDTIQYVRMLKEKGITIIFEKENINTSTMESEMQLALLSTLAQNEVESLSANVKLGVKMKMKRGEMMGFNGCLGYDYHSEDKTITINPEEAETVRFIFERYIQGYGSTTIVKELKKLGKLNKKGVCQWGESGIRGIIKNEKYKGDLLLGKTYTVDPISKRRLENRGEEDKFYIKNHHEPIVSEEVWDKAQEIRKSRYSTGGNVDSYSRTRYSKMYAFSSMCECGFCGANYIRRKHHQSRTSVKPVWKCSVQISKGTKECVNSKAIDEAIIENAFLEMMKLLSDNFEDVMENLLNSIEKSLETNDYGERLKRLERQISKLHSKKKKLTDMLLDDKINEEAYDEKYNDITRKLNKLGVEKKVISDNNISQKNIKTRMNEIRNHLKDADVFDKFDRTVFESIVKKVIIGEVTEDGTVDPYKIIFVLKGMEDFAVPNVVERYKKS